MNTISLKLQPETIAQLLKVPVGTVSHRSSQLGVDQAEPLLVAMDGLLRYAKAHKARYEGLLCEDWVIGPYWLESVKGIRGLLNGDGAVALERGITTDSKDNSAIEGLFWDCLKAAGFKESDL